jgi:acylphosphatase
MDLRRVRIVVRGRVQGVFYRASTQRRALELGLAGWVRNAADGSVEILADGPGAALLDLIEWCRSGPSGARVDGLETEWLEAEEGDRIGFRISR